MNPQVPTGNTSEIVRQYYQYIYSYWLGRTGGQNFTIRWEIYAWVALWIVVLVGGFYIYTRWQRYTRAEKEPYPVESYNGYIQESNGPVGPFLTLFFIAMFVWLVIMTVLNILNGQIY
jgi:heme/copper-type cytochrome/quinol oxidase subunit 2